MNLGGLKKLASTIGAKVFDAARDPRPTAGRHVKYTNRMRTVVVVKEKKNSVQIKCWTCGYLVWVKKGSRCHTIGLCGSCIATFDEKSDTTLVQIK
jgi:hypothetical protein